MSEIRINPRKFVRWALLVCAGLLVLHVVSYWPIIKGSRDEAIHFLNMDGEQSLPALFSTALLWTVGLLAGGIACADGLSRLKRIQWGVLGGIFIFLGIDESTSLHERLIHPIREGLNLSGIFYFAWVVPFAILLLVFLVAYTPFLLQLPKDTRWRIVLAGVLYVGGALGCELIDGAWASVHGGENAVYAVLVTIEESLELLGCIVMIRALLLHISAYHPELRLAVGGPSDT